MELSHIDPSSSSAIVHGVVVGNVSPTLLTSWRNADISHALFLLPAMTLFSCFSVPYSMILYMRKFWQGKTLVNHTGKTNGKEKFGK